MWTEAAIARELEGRFFDIWGNDQNELRRLAAEHRAGLRAAAAEQLRENELRRAAQTAIEKEFAKHARITPASIVAAVSYAHLVKPSDLVGETRKSSVMPARHHAYWLLREIKGYSFPQIGSFFKRDHSTVLHGWRVWEKRRHNFPAQEAEVIKQLNITTHSAMKADSGVSAEPRQS